MYINFSVLNSDKSGKVAKAPICLKAFRVGLNNLTATKGRTLADKLFSCENYTINLSALIRWPFCALRQESGNLMSDAGVKKFIGGKNVSGVVSFIDGK